jgi:hypothetical protein
MRTGARIRERAGGRRGGSKVNFLAVKHKKSIKRAKTILRSFYIFIGVKTINNTNRIASSFFPVD